MPSGADRSRPALARLLREIASGKTPSWCRWIDWRDRSAHLLAVIEPLKAKGAYFRSPRIRILPSLQRRIASPMSNAAWLSGAPRTSSISARVIG